MLPQHQRTTLNAYARLGGFMYLLVIVVYVAGDTIVSRYNAGGDFAQISARIHAAETLYRCGLALELVSSVATVLLGGAFFVLLSPIDRNLALFAFLWRLMEAVFGCILVTFRFAAIPIYLGSATGVTATQQAGVAQLASEMAHASFPVSVICFAAGSILYFYLMLRSRVVPHGIAALGLVASAFVVIMGFLTLIAPAAANRVPFLWAPIFIAEVITGLWFLIRGADLAFLDGRPLSVEG